VIDMRGSVALVTGAASGIGRAAAVALADKGMSLALIDLDADGLLVTADECRERAVEALQLVGDVGDPDAVTGLFTEARRLGRISAVLNNAGISMTGELCDTTDEQWARLLRTNLTGCFNVAREAARRMTVGPDAAVGATAGGAIVNTASELALIGQAGYVAYSATKGGVLGLTRAMAAELAPRGIRVNALCPGETETPMLAREFAVADDPEAERRAHERSIPLGRIAGPAEIASAAVYLLSDASSYMTGVALVIDGGRTSCVALG